MLGRGVRLFGELSDSPFFVAFTVFSTSNVQKMTVLWASERGRLFMESSKPGNAENLDFSRLRAYNGLKIGEVCLPIDDGS